MKKASQKQRWECAAYLAARLSKLVVYLILALLVLFGYMISVEPVQEFRYLRF